MGNKQQTLKKGIGYRIISIRPKSPLENLLEPFFDFIIQTIIEPSPKDILSKLTNQIERQEQKPFIKRIKEQEGKTLKLKIYSTKFQNTRQVQFIPNSNWNGSEDLIGITFRLENYQTARAKYCRIVNIQKNSPVELAKFQQKDYLIGVVDFKYDNMDELIDHLYEIFYDKEIPNKTVKFVTYNIKKDRLNVHSVELKKKWGGDGLLGCQFLEGYLYKFPKNLQEVRKKMIQQQKEKVEVREVREQLLRSDGSGKILAETLRKKNKQPKQKKIVIKPEFLQTIKNIDPVQKTIKHENINEKNPQKIQNSLTNNDNLQLRVATLQKLVKDLQQIILSQIQLNEKEQQL